MPQAWVTLLFFPLLVYLAFIMDKSSDITWLTRHPITHAMIKCVLPERPEGELPSSFLLDVKHSDGSPLTGEELTKLVRASNPLLSPRRPSLAPYSCCSACLLHTALDGSPDSVSAGPTAPPILFLQVRRLP